MLENMVRLDIEAWERGIVLKTPTMLIVYGLRPSWKKKTMVMLLV